MDVMADLKIVTGDRSGHNDRMEKTHGDSKERLTMGKPREWMAIHRRVEQTGLAVKAFGMSNDLLTPDQVEEAAVKENMLQQSPRMWLGYYWH